jgi:hypothetical protein
MKEIVITTSPDGQETQVEANGYKGKGCEKTVSFFMPETKTNRVTSHKPEFNQNPTAIEVEKEKLKC